MAGPERESFMSRWSRRKQQSQEAAEPEAFTEVTLEQAEDAPLVEEVERPEPVTEEEALEQLREDDPELADQLQAVNIDELSYEDDFTVFMKDKVPDILKRKALNKLWSSNPLFGHLDRLNEYDEDYSDAAMLVGEFKSSWMPGTGYGPVGNDDVNDAIAATEGLPSRSAALEAGAEPDDAGPANDTTDRLAESEEKTPERPDSDQEQPVSEGDESDLQDDDTADDDDLGEGDGHPV